MNPNEFSGPALEYGIDPAEYLDSHSNRDLQGSQCVIYSDTSDDIISSSPSPPERSIARYEAPCQSIGLDEVGDCDINARRDWCSDFPHFSPSYSATQPLAYPIYRVNSDQNSPLDNHITSSQAVYRSAIEPSAVDRIGNAHNFRGAGYHGSHGQHSQAQHGHPETQEQVNRARGVDHRNNYGIRLRPVSELPDMHRGIFKFGVFNAIQSACFPDIVDSNQNMVISAPTGSGKTVLFELAILRLLSGTRKGNSPKCVYMAPTKALCSERYRDWTSKFEPLGIKCCELTGDTMLFGKGVWGDARNASIIITTSEKWDSLTRNWQDHDQILSTIQLFLVDEVEVHILNENRGSTLEVVISRMRSRGSSFGEEFRPCKLTRIVIGIHRQKSHNDFTFNKLLDYKLFGALQKHSVGKPILVFCSTRKGVFGTAEQLMKEYREAEKARQTVPWTHPTRVDHAFHDQRLAELASIGIGVHHAGLTVDDRRATEDFYMNGTLRIIVATSTLAVGVNLPAHTVVIKGVQTFQNNTSVEYSDLDIMQMLGRAGRPQFDKDGIAIIFCEAELEGKYRTLVSGKTILESSLHRNLSEHINSEVGLGTIKSITSARNWLRGSFLFQRIRKNPGYYAIGKQANQTWEERVDDLVIQNIERLRQTQLIEYVDEGGGNGELRSTEYGDIMSKFYIRQSTMGLILALPECPTLREILEMISASEELSDAKLRAAEKLAFNKLRKHNDIRFGVGKVEKTSDKVFLLIQAVLGGISLNVAEFKSGDSQIHLEAFSVFRHVSRIARGMSCSVVEVAVVMKRGAQLKHALELVRCLTAKAWEDRPVVLRQIEQIGEKSLKVLAEHGITSLSALEKQDTLRIETLLNRRPPFGLEVLASVKELPHYFLKITELNFNSNGGKSPVEIELSIECCVMKDEVGTSKSKRTKNRGLSMTAILILTSDLDFIDFRRIPTKALNDTKTFEVTTALNKPSQSIVVMITSETIAGVTVTQCYKPKLSSQEYPTMDTRPVTSIDMDLAGLGDCSDLWNLELDMEAPSTVRDLTKCQCLGSVSSGLHKLNFLIPTKAANTDPHTDRAMGTCTTKQRADGKYEYGSLNMQPFMQEQDNLSTFMVNQSPPLSLPEILTTSVVGMDCPSLPVSKDAQPLLIRSSQQLEALESLHGRTNTEFNLKLSRGQRLKLDSPTQLKKRHKMQPDFKIELADLNDTGPPNPPLYELAELGDGEDEDLPEPHEILTANPSNVASSPETSYSNSEIDSLIRALPSPTGPPDVINTPVAWGGFTSGATSKLPATTCPSVKRGRKIENYAASRKRRRVQLSPTPEVPYDVPLFLASEQSGEHADYGLDSELDLMDLLPSAPSTPLERSSPGFDGASRRFPGDTPLARAPDIPDPSGESQQGAERGEYDDTDDEFAKLDAWMNSGAVEIVYDK
ncbi:hypothetical protein BD779DRAFT_1670146 [Infundibulicybe gibba]|nr:hypothetical protein BD779DRAFT_1670146 [Infundibulicybe gibba]